MLLSIQSNAHPPISLDTWSAQAAIDNLEVSVAHTADEVNRLLNLDGDSAERILRSAQESWLNGAYEQAAKKRLAVTMVAGFKKHPARAAIFQWLGISYRSLAFFALAQEMFIAAYAEPRQTQTTRTATVEQ